MTAEFASVLDWAGVIVAVALSLVCLLAPYVLKKKTIRRGCGGGGGCACSLALRKEKDGGREVNGVR